MGLFGTYFEETKLSKMKKESGGKVQACVFEDRKKVEVLIPYVHKISHNIKKVDTRHGIHSVCGTM